MNTVFFDALKKNPIIASVRNEEEVDRAVKSRAEAIFIIHIDMNHLIEQVKKIKKSGKLVFIHVDLIPGFSSSPLALEYIYKLTKPDGILTTKKSIINKAKSLDLISILRVFVIDSPTIASSSKLIKEVKPDLVEILPGIAPKAIKLIKEKINIPVISGGMIETKEEVIACIKSGAIGVSSSSENLIK
ncbi:glycerol-3-phosphate responsive antiterminator [Anaerofustis sp.]|uniref:glycerol-3-phosphate responsive antiterminator n=1 Tax=Anaerofustis sp. TaxID=1872517 RepID=UPI0025C73FE4|nr:glycerol-3-phosphate responsive antiterminator [Anaerofustis sp.]